MPAPGRRYTRCVRVLIPILVVILFIAWVCLDPLFCPDGCGYAAAGSAIAPVNAPDGCCVLCHAALGLGWCGPQLVRGPSVRYPQVLIRYGVASTPPLRIDHPPRA